MPELLPWFFSRLFLHSILSAIYRKKKSRNTPMNGLNRQCIYHNLPPIKSPAPSSSLCPTRLQFQFPKIFGHTSSLRNGPCFWLWPVPANQTTGHSSFTLHTVTRFQRPELHHYYGFICHLPLLRIILGFPLISPIPQNGNNARLPRLRRTPCEQCHPQSHHGSDQELGFALFWTLTHP